MSGFKRFLISLFFAFLILIIVLFFHYEANKKFYQLQYDDFSIFVMKGNQLRKTDILNLGENAYILIYNISGFERDSQTGKLDLNVILKVYTEDGIILSTKRVILPLIRDFQGEVIPQVKVIYVPKGLIPGIYKLEISIYDAIGEKTFSKSKRLIISGKIK